MTDKHEKTGQPLKKIPRKKKAPTKKAASKPVAKSDTNGAPPKPRQGGLPGIEEPHFAELAGYADELQVAKESAKSVGDLVKRKEAALIAAMKKRGRTEYTDRGRNIYIRLTVTEHAKVTQFNHKDEDKLV